jgi:3-methyladenine DNA glycosylase AlkD
MLEQLINELKAIANPELAKRYQRFFKTGKGQYGEGDIFLGIRTPALREIAKKYAIVPMEDLQELLNSKIHEHRFSALLILLNKYKKSRKNPVEKMRIFQFYLKNTRRINNWDLVDVSAPNIVGDFSVHEGNEMIRYLARSDNLWEKRIAIISTFAFIKRRSFGETLAVADILVNDKHDLIHKAVGWALREMGKKNPEVLEIFLKTRYKEMPRTMLRYAIEKMPEEKRKDYLKGKI